jgi:hypothetical protein
MLGKLLSAFICGVLAFSMSAQGLSHELALVL